MLHGFLLLLHIVRGRQQCALGHLLEGKMRRSLKWIIWWIVHYHHFGLLAQILIKERSGSCIELATSASLRGQLAT